MKLEIKEIKDEFPEYKTNLNTDNLPKNKIICKNNKVIHHDHCLPEDNILGYICQNCNLQIKNKKEILIIFHNGMNYYHIYHITRFVYVCFFCSLVKSIRSSYFLGILPCNFIQAVYKFIYTSLYI